MIVRLNNKETIRKKRLIFYHDDVFVIAHEVLRPLQGELDIVEIFLSAERFANYLIENRIIRTDMMSYEVEDVENELHDERDRKLLFVVTFLKLCALRHRIPVAQDVALALVPFCQRYDDFTDLLVQFDPRERRMMKENGGINLMAYELRSLKQEQPDLGQAREVVKTLVDCATQYTPEAMERMLNPLRDLNRQYDNAFDQDIDRLRQTMNMKGMMAKEVVLQKHVDTQIGQVEQGGTGVIKYYEQNGH